MKTSWLTTSVGRKQLVGLTGIGLSLFVLTHMLGNMLILVSPQKYNEYSHALVSNPLLIVAELGLLAIFLGHMKFAMGLAASNFRARNSRYAILPNGPKGTSVIQRSLWAQGLLLLVFIISHLITFKYGQHYNVTYGSTEMRDLHRLVVEVFHEPGYVAWYLVALVVLGLHLSHGVSSTFQTFGIHHPRYQPAIKAFGWVYAVIVTFGFISQPLYVYLIYRG